MTAYWQWRSAHSAASAAEGGIPDRLTRLLPESNVQNLPDVVADAGVGLWILDVAQD